MRKIGKRGKYFGMMRWAGLGLLLPCVASLAASTSVPPIRIYDGPGGATCEFFDVALGLPWLSQGGDWIDATSAPRGTQAYGVVEVPPVAKPAPIEYDVTAMLRDAAKAGGFVGFAISGAGGGETVLATRENKDPSLRPELVLEFASQSPIRLPPRADTFTDCTSNSSLGRQEIMRASGRQLAILDFDVATVPLERLAKARLVLHPTGLYGAAGRLALYRLGGRASEGRPPVKEGLAARGGENALERQRDVLFVERFEQTGWSKHWSILSVRSGAERVPRPGGGAAAGHALKVTIKTGVNLGLDLRYRFKDKLGSEPEEAYLRYYVFFPDVWVTPVDGGKLPGLAGTYGRAGWGGRTPDGYNGWNMRMLFRKQAPADHPMHDRVAVGTEATLPKVPDMRNEGYFVWPTAMGGVLEKNRWYCIEQYVKLNTPGRNDGVFRGWADGRLAFERTDLVYRNTHELKIEEAWMNVYHGGQQPTPQDISMYIDDVVIARQYVGPARDSRSAAKH